MSAALFPLGRVVATPAALEALVASGVSPTDLLERHRCGDWGEVLPEDSREDEFSLKHGFRILSQLPCRRGVRLDNH